MPSSSIGFYEGGAQMDPTRMQCHQQIHPKEVFLYPTIPHIFESLN
jgi:hypothetical protein